MFHDTCLDPKYGIWKWRQSSLCNIKIKFFYVSVPSPFRLQSSRQAFKFMFLNNNFTNMHILFPGMHWQGDNIPTIFYFYMLQQEKKQKWKKSGAYQWFSSFDIIYDDKGTFLPKILNNAKNIFIPLQIDKRRQSQKI